MLTLTRISSLTLKSFWFLIKRSRSNFVWAETNLWYTGKDPPGSSLIVICHHPRLLLLLFFVWSMCSIHGTKLASSNELINICLGFPRVTLMDIINSLHVVPNIVNGKMWRAVGASKQLVDSKRYCKHRQPRDSNYFHFWVPSFNAWQCNAMLSAPNPPMCILQQYATEKVHSFFHYLANKALGGLIQARRVLPDFRKKKTTKNHPTFLR